MKQPKFKGYNKEEGKWYYGFGWCDTDYTDEYMKKKGIAQEAMLYTDSGVVHCELDSMEQIIEDNLLFEEDQKIINNALNLYPLGSYQIGEIAVLSALLYERGIDVVEKLKEML